MWHIIVGLGRERSMQLHTLTNAIFSVEKMAGSEGQPYQLVVQLHKISKQATALIKRHQSVLRVSQESAKERQHLKKKLRKIAARLEKKEEECQQLHNELARTKDIYDHKITKLIRAREERSDLGEQGQQEGGRDRCYRGNKSREVQCEILNECLVKELQERNIWLLKKLSQLERQLEEEKNENNSKQLYIDSMLTALDSEADSDSQSHHEHPQTHSRPTCEDINDVSTIDADSLKDEEPQPDCFEERREWAGDGQGVEKAEGLYSSMQNAFKRVKSWIWRV